MRAYHIRDVSEGYKKDYIYVPEENIFTAYLREKAMKTIIDYSIDRQLNDAKAVVEGRETEVKKEVVREFNIDKGTVKKIRKNRNKCILCTDDLDGTTECLVRVLSGENKRKGILGRIFF